jgi:glycosyltransferase involved in cell wall biosynthesis
VEGLVRAVLGRPTSHRFSLLFRPGEPLSEELKTAAHGPHRLLPIHAALRSPRDQWETPLRLRQARADLYHATYFAAALRPGPPTVITIYDLIPELYPEYWPRGHGQVIRRWLRYSAHSACQVVAPSEASAADIRRLYELPAHRVKVCYVALPELTGSEVFERPPEVGGRAFLLCVCTNKPHKNLPRLVKAYGKVVAESLSPPDLLIAGGWDARYPETIEEANALKWNRAANSPTVRFIHNPTDHTLTWLYGHAMAFVFPSIYEGFGIPVLEAMRADLPVAASQTAAVAEVAGKAALLFDPLNEEAIAAAMSRLTDEPELRERLAAAGKVQANRFSLGDSAARIMQIYDEALC